MESCMVIYGAVNVFMSEKEILYEFYAEERENRMIRP